MKLLYVAPSAYLLGGVQDWLADLVAGQRALGVEVTVAVPDDALHRLAPYAERFPGLEPIAFRNPSGSEAGRIDALAGLLKRHPEHLVAGVNIAALYPAVRRLRRQGAFRGRVVMTLHALEPEYYADLQQQRDLLDAVVATNRLSAALACDLGGIEPQRVLHAPYGVATEVDPQLAAMAANDAGRLAMVWVGRLERSQKRVQDIRPILEALDGIDQPFSLAIAGDGPERGALELELAPWLERGCLRFTGTIPRQRLRREVYAPGRVLLITSGWETGPIVAWEAMAAGMAVVSSRFLGSGLEQALVHGHTALLYPIGEAGAAATQLSLLASEGRLAELAAAGQDLVRRRYSREASLTSWMQAFATVESLPALPHPAAGPEPAGGGRLDQLLGPTGAGTLRRLLRRRFHHLEAGSEWPHSGHGPFDDTTLLARAAALEAHG